MELPIFPLNGAVLFPGTNLPLNIFEDRYLQMVDYALSKDRVIGMIQTNTNKKLHNVGCIGRITNFSETNDGRYLINLQGSKCFNVKKELNYKHDFRIVEALVIDNNNEELDRFTKIQKDELLNIYIKYIEAKKISLDIAEIKKIDLSQLIKLIAMVSPFKDVEKQVLLETQNSYEFYNKLLSIIDIEINGGVDKRSIN